MLYNYDLIRLFSLTITNSHISNSQTEKHSCIYANKQLDCFHVAVNDEHFSCFENLFMNTTEKRDYLITNAVPTYKDIILLSKKEIAKLLIVTPDDIDLMNEFFDNIQHFNIDFEFISLQDKQQLLKNIAKDEKINFNDSSF